MCSSLMHEEKVETALVESHEANLGWKPHTQLAQLDVHDVHHWAIWASELTPWPTFFTACLSFLSRSESSNKEHHTKMENQGWSPLNSPFPPSPGEKNEPIPTKRRNSKIKICKLDFFASDFWSLWNAYQGTKYQQGWRSSPLHKDFHTKPCRLGSVKNTMPRWDFSDWRLEACPWYPCLKRTCAALNLLNRTTQICASRIKSKNNNNMSIKFYCYHFATYRNPHLLSVLSIQRLQPLCLCQSHLNRQLNDGVFCASLTPSRLYWWYPVQSCLSSLQGSSWNIIVQAENKQQNTTGIIPPTPPPPKNTIKLRKHLLLIMIIIFRFRLLLG